MKEVGKNEDGTTVENTGEEGATPVVLSFRDKMRPVLKEKYPDRNMDDDEEFEKGLDEYHTGMSEELGRHRKTSEVLGERFAANPSFAAFFADVHSGEDMIVSLVRHFGDDLASASTDPERMERITQEVNGRGAKMKQEQELAAEQAKNWDASLVAIAEFQKESGKSDEEMNTLMDAIMEKHTNGIMGIFSKKDLEDYDKMINYDADVDEAAQVGKAEGLNEQIDLKKKKTSPSVPVLNGGAAGGGEAAPSDPALQLLDGMNKRQSLRERGTARR